MGSLQLKSIRKTYGTHEVLKDIDLEVKGGEFVIFVGPSGCGKSTLLRSIAGLEDVTSGTVLINGRDETLTPPAKRGIAMVFQSYALYPHLTVKDNMGLGLKQAGKPKDEIEKRVTDASGMLSLAPYLARRPAELSGGQRQRVAMCRALVRNPQVFLFDEPLSNLDAKLRVDMRTEIKRLHQRMGTTIVYVTHDQIEAMTLATKIAVLRDGVLQQFGTPAEIYNSPANVFVADFMGSPAMNLLNATVENGAGGLQVSLDRPNAEPLKLPVPSGNNSLTSYNGKPVIFGIRPEALTDLDGVDRKAKSVSHGDCMIEVVEPAGADTFAVTKLGGKSVVARLGADAGIEAGTNTRLAFNLDKAVFFDPQSQLRIA